MPKLSDSMEEGTILSWLEASGDHVEVGDELLEIETDKSTSTHIAEAAGVLEILVEEGTTVAVGEPIARIGSTVAEPEHLPTDPGSPEAVVESDTAVASSAVTLGPEVARPDAVSGNGNGRRVAATPVARRIAAAHGVALDGIHGTGPLGRITRADVLGLAGLAASDTQALPTIRPAVPSSSPASALPAADTQFGGAFSVGSTTLSTGARRREPSRLQQLIARRMVQAKATIPHFQVQTEVAIDAAIALRADWKALAGDGEPVPSFNDIVIKAAAVALREHPLANGSYQDEGFVLHDAINVGIAVAADDALLVPTVFDAAGKSLSLIALETRALAARVRSGEISPAELAGGTFTVSNLGMFGMTAITPVINPPQAAILGVGAMRETLVRVGGQIVDRTFLTLTLSCDHRILYGADAARFLACIRELLETPLKLAL
jgi:pyruvate dehydrogenase E2 component (dihydrolipoamide acetyltransferase)